MSSNPPWLARAVSWCGSAVDAAAGNRLSILIFHRVLPRPDPLFPDEIDAAQFDRLMTLVAGGYNVLSLGRALPLLATSQLPPRALVITFDDGYADNAEIALPILRRHGLVATFFVASGFLDGGRMWNDTVIECLRRTDRDSVDLGDFGLARFATTTTGERRAAIAALLPRLKYLALTGREDALVRLRTLTAAAALPDDLMMTSQHLQAMHVAGMEIGGHTTNHPILTALSDADARAEIDGGRRRLQELLDAPIDVFAYPNGRPGRDYDARHVAMVRELGFRGAVSTAAGAALPGADLFQLPRFTPWDLQLPRWAARLLLTRLRAGRFDVAGAQA